MCFVLACVISLLAPTPQAAALRTSGGGLRLPTATGANPAPIMAPTSDHFVGLDFDTLAATGFVRVSEIVLDGQLGPVSAGPEGPFNLALWDVSNPAAPALVPGTTLSRTTSTRNRRTSLPVNWLLPPSRHYRLVARVTQLRSTPILGPLLEGSLHTLGGLNFQDLTPSTGQNVANALVDPTKLYLAIRFRPARVNEWADLGGAMTGSNGRTPILVGSGALLAGTTVSLNLREALPATTVYLMLSSSLDCQPLLGGTLLPDNPFITQALWASAAGAANLSFPMPAGIPSGFALLAQGWLLDPNNPNGVSATNAVWITAP